MANKYDKYFLTDSPWKQFKFIMGPIIQRMDTKTIQGSNFYFIHWVLPHAEPRMKIGHPPHIHSEPELLIHIGTNPNDPDDLGGEVELCMGPEMEKHVITKTTVVFIPPNFIHAPWNPIKTVRPWIFIEINQGLHHTEKFYPQLLTKEHRSKLDWSFWHDDAMSIGYPNMPVPEKKENKTDG
jgi:hypothetical protein